MQVDLGKNYFELFGLPVSFELDTAGLAARYRDLQRSVHPDRFANASDQERRLSLQLTAQINEAYQTLREPVRRGRYMLRLRGVETGEDTDTAMDPDFLVEQMELRERLDELRGLRDRQAKLRILADEVEARLKAGVQDMGRALSTDSAEAGTRARAKVRELQFLTRLRHELQELEHSD